MSNSTIKLILIDDDPIFRLGLCTALEDRNFADLQVLAQGELDLLEQLLEQFTPELLLLTIGSKNLVICQKILDKYPQLKIVLLTANYKKQQVILAQNYGVKAYVVKGNNIREVVKILKLVASGETYWENQSANDAPPIKLSWLSCQCQGGLAQINYDLEQVEKNLKQPKLPLIDYLFWQGRKRELLAASWLVKQLFPADVIALTQQIYEQSYEENYNSLSPFALNLYNHPNISENKHFNNTWMKINQVSKNISQKYLDFEVLQDAKQQELLLIVIEQIATILQKLKTDEKLDEQEFGNQGILILQEIWQRSTIEFLSRYYIFLEYEQENNILMIINQQSRMIKTTILEKIPLAQDYFAYLLFDKPFVIDRVAYRLESPETSERAEFLLQNIIIEITNAVIVVILNQPNIQENLISKIYKKNFLSSRELARFRNELAWQYWKKNYWEEPRNIFEDRYSLLVFEANYIRQLYISHPRQEELEELKGIAWLLTLIIEIQDAIVPRFKTMIDWFGRALVYLLTEIIGRGIGLIGKGIIQGIGNSLQRKE